MIRKMKITEKEILEYIAGYIAKHCYAPSHTEIAEDLDISPGTVKKHIKNLFGQRNSRDGCRTWYTASDSHKKHIRHEKEKT